MDFLLFLVLIALIGLVTGGLARLLLPGPDPMSIPQTMALGVTGSFIAGLIAYYVFGEEEGAGFLFGLIVTVGLVFGARKLRERDAGPRP